MVGPDGRRGAQPTLKVTPRGSPPGSPCAGGDAVGLLRGASAGGLSCSISGGAGGRGGGTRRANAATRALGSGGGEGSSSSLSIDDKLAAARAARAKKPTQGCVVGATYVVAGAAEGKAPGPRGVAWGAPSL